MTVFLVGAGPGDPGLLTVRARELLTRADVVLHDQLIPFEALELVPPEAEVIDVGKIGGGRQVPQSLTTDLLVEKGRDPANGVVVRLKGGDPFVFGRGGEEAQALRAARVPFEVVPGVTAGIAASAFAGIPVTQRQVAAGVAFVTGHEDPAKPETQLDWPALAAFPGTLVLYMGVRALPRIAEQLVAGGRPADEPAAIVERGTLPGQRVVRATLSTLPAAAADAGIRAPAITVVGAVAALHDEIEWLTAARPLLGVSVAVTRARAQASALAARLRELGADVVEAPTIRTRALPFDPPELREGDWVVFTSPSGVEALFAGLGDRDARAFGGTRVAAIGPGTADALLARGLRADLVPDRSASEGLIAELAGEDLRRVVVVRAREGRETFLDWLRERGVEAELVTPYETVPADLDPDVRDRALACDWAVFASGSSVRSLHASAGTLDGPRIASIGPATSAVLRDLGREPDVEAEVHTPDGLVDALLRAVS